MKQEVHGKSIAIIGLGYVGLPLALSFGQKGFSVTGFDISRKRIEELRRGMDCNKSVAPEELHAHVRYTAEEKDISGSDIFIITVPTPVDEKNNPDLSFIVSAGEVVGRNIKKGAVVILESTVYPGATEEILLPVLEKRSGLKGGHDFKIAYSPERINPGDRQHTLRTVVKIVSANDPETLDFVAALYGQIAEAGTYKCTAIRTAEAAKVIENIQRDLNIALINELSIIFRRMGIDTKDVLAAAATKWNFHPYTPGLVGGHCIPVDPYYLVWKAIGTGYTPKLITAGRRVNNAMPDYVADLAIMAMVKEGRVLKGAKVLLMGASYKEDVTDARNSPVTHLIGRLDSFHIQTIVFDPLVSREGVEKEFRREVAWADSLEGEKDIDCIIIPTPHQLFRKISLDTLAHISKTPPIVVDVKGVLDGSEARKRGFIYITL